MTARSPARIVLAGLAVFVLAVSVLESCAGSSGDDATATTTTAAPTTSTTAPPDYAGDADSPFCRLVSAAVDRPVRDPFEAGLEPREVQVRFLALSQRFSEFAAVAPPELSDDLDALVGSLQDLGDVLAAAGWDFSELARSGADMGSFDDPALRRHCRTDLRLPRPGVRPREFLNTR